MKYRNAIKKILFGSSLPKDYLCVQEGVDYPLSIFLTGKDNRFEANISHCHIFLGYKPLVIGVVLKKYSSEAEWLSRNDQVCFFVKENFTLDSQWKGLSTDQRTIARLSLRKIKSLELGEYGIFVLQGESGEHQFLSSWHQATNRIRKQIKSQPLGNVDLPGNLHDQVVIAYATPRNIKVITVAEHDRMNMFPTDLHGPAGGKFYLSSLRIGGKANDQVESIGTIAISRIEVSWHTYAYEAGKNHMIELQPKNRFRLSSFQSKHVGIPLPEAVLSYMELKLVNSFDVGIHRIHSFEIICEEETANGIGLAHIHKYYAQWRLDNHQPFKMYER